MKKSVLGTLGLVTLALVILQVWFNNQPSTDLVDIGAGIKHTQDAAVDSSVPSRSRGHDAAAKSLADSPTSSKTPMAGSSMDAASAFKLVQPARVKKQDSAFQVDEQPEGLTISGLVQDEAGYPLANIVVLAEPIHPSAVDTFSGDPSFEVARSTSTGFDGSFVLSNLSDNEYRIRTSPVDGFASAETTARVGELTVNLMLMRQRDVQIWGIVNSTEGDLLENVQIIAGPPTRVTDTGPEGDYVFDISIKGKKIQTIQFRHKDYRDQSVKLTSEDLGDLFDYQLDIYMEPLKGLTTVTGRLEDPDGQPVPGVKIKIRSPKLRTSYRAQSDEMGHFSMEGVEPGGDYRLLARPKADFRDYERVHLEIPAGGLQHDIVLEPLNQGVFSGNMTDVNGQPIPGVVLTLQSKVARGRSVQVVGDSAGFFVVERFPEGSAVLKSSSYPIFTIQGIRASPEVEEPVAVVLDIGPHALFGRVTTVFGDTVAGAEVSLGWKHSENGVQCYSDRKTAADQNGDFVFTGLGSGVHTIRVRSPGFSVAIIKSNIGLGSDKIVVELHEES